MSWAIHVSLMRYTNLQEDGTDEEEIELVLAGEGSGNRDARIPAQRAYQHVDNVLEQSYVAAQRQQNWYARCCPALVKINLHRPGVTNGHFTFQDTPVQTATGSQ